MFNRDLIVKVGQRSCELDQLVTIYRYDRNIQLTIKLIQYDYEFDQVIENDLLKENKIYKAQTVLKSPKGEVWRDPLIETEIKNDTVKVNFKDVMLDEKTEVGKYQMQIHLFDKDGSRVTIHAFNIFVEDLIGYSNDKEFDSGDKGGTMLEGGGEVKEGDVIASDWLNDIEQKLVECFSPEFYNTKEYSELLTENKETTFALNELVEEYNYLNELYLYLISLGYKPVSAQSVILNDNVMAMSNSKKVTNIEVLNWKDNKFDVGEYRLYRFKTNLLSIYEKYQVRFKSKDPSIAKCNSTGKVLGVSRGTTVITAYNKDNPSVNFKFPVYIGPYIPATSIVFNSLKKTVKVGEIFSVDYKINPYNATTTGITWEILTGSDVLSLHGDKFVALKEGVAYIKATLENGVRCMGEITVVSNSSSGGDPIEEVTGIRVYPKIATTPAYKKVYLQCYTTPNQLDITDIVTWSSSDPETATVNEKGIVKGLKIGEVTITASFLDGKYTDTAVITVTEPTGPDDDYDYTGIHLELSPDGSKIIVTWEPSESPRPPLEWILSNDNIIVDEDGNITYVKDGTTDVTVRIPGTDISDTITIESKASKTYTKIKIIGDLSLDSNGETQLDFIWEDASLPKPPVTWSSSNNKIAIVDQNGLVKVLSNGKVIIRCSYNDKVYGEIIIEVKGSIIRFIADEEKASDYIDEYMVINGNKIFFSEINRMGNEYTYFYPSCINTIRFYSISMTKLLELDTSNVKDASYMFEFCKSLTTIPKLDTSNVTTMLGMFSGCESLTTIPKLDTSNVTNMGLMFARCKSLTTIPQLYTSKVISMNGMFENCNPLRSIPTLDTSNVTDMCNMFKGCIRLTEIPPLNTSKVNAMSDMFLDCWNLKTIPPLDTSKVEFMSNMFYNCTSLENIPPLNTSNVESMYGMFYHCYSLVEIPPLNTSKITDMQCMFLDCRSLLEIPQLDTSNVTIMHDLFNGCMSLTSIPELDTSNVTDMSCMFRNCESLTTIPQLDTSKVTNMVYMFSGCISMTGTADPSKYWDKSNVTEFTRCFYYCTKLSNYSEIPDDWK